MLRSNLLGDLLQLLTYALIRNRTDTKDSLTEKSSLPLRGYPFRTSSSTRTFLRPTLHSLETIRMVKFAQIVGVTALFSHAVLAGECLSQFLTRHP